MEGLGNYESDSDSFDEKVEKKKADLIANDTWGQKKRNFYRDDREVMLGFRVMFIGRSFQ